MSAPEMSTTVPRILIIGFGNPGRLDDGLGPAFAQQFRRYTGPLSLSVTDPYQLTVENTLDLLEHDCIVFADAIISGAKAFEFNRIEASPNAELGSHTLEPSTLLQLCKTLYQRVPDAYQLAIRGFEFDGFGELLSARARENLEAAVAYFIKWLSEFERNWLTHGILGSPNA